MFLEALEILQSAGENASKYATDFALYKVISILVVYCPLMVATFLLSQEYLGKKIACFAPDNFTDGQSGAMDEYCWNNGFWTSDGVELAKSLYTQPHRYFAFYLAAQAIICMAPSILWNVTVKSKLLAVLRGTEEYLADLLKLVENEKQADAAVLEEKVKSMLKQFHSICLEAARSCNLARAVIVRQFLEMFLFITFLLLQFLIYDFREGKHFRCEIQELASGAIACTVPILDLLDVAWMFNVATLFIGVVLVVVFVLAEFRSHFGSYQPMFINDLPYGDETDFNEHIKWDSNTTKHSYELLTMLFEENTTIMTKVYVLNAMQPYVPKTDDEEDTSLGEDEHTFQRISMSETFPEEAKTDHDEDVEIIQHHEDVNPEDVGLRKRNTGEVSKMEGTAEPQEVKTERSSKDAT